MVSSCGRWVIAFNGEIYNFRDVRKRLESRGRGFRGHSDTEVLLEAISEWGIVEALRASEGMLALAAWDRQERALYLARDRVGKKPLYFARAGSSLVFGSELKALRVHPEFSGEIDRGALSLYLRHNCIPAPYSIFRDTRKVVPGTILRITSRQLRDYTGCQEILDSAQVYWSAREAVDAGLAHPYRGSDEEALEELDQRLRAAVAKRMVADVPLGAFLSGGIDSSTVVALMQTQSNAPIRTFTIGIESRTGNEAEEAKRVAHHLGTAHTELYVTTEQARAVIPRLPTLYDEPFADSSQIPTFLVSQLAREDVTVALSGDGGDELFGGYNRHFWAERLWRLIDWVPPLLRRNLSTALTSLRPRTWDRVFGAVNTFLPLPARQFSAGYKLHKLAEVMTCDDLHQVHQRFASHWDDPSSIVVGGHEPPTLLNPREPWTRTLSPVERMMYLDLVTYLPDDILVKVDRASMAVSLEARNPLLDPQVVSFVWSLPLSMKVRNGKGKWLLRQLLYKYVPQTLVDRPKSGFGIPIGAWLRGPLRDWAETLLDERKLKAEGYLHPAPIRQRWVEHLSGKRDWQYHIWDVLMFEAWLA